MSKKRHKDWAGTSMKNMILYLKGEKTILLYLWSSYRWQGVFWKPYLMELENSQVSRLSGALNCENLKIHYWKETFFPFEGSVIELYNYAILYK